MAKRNSLVGSLEQGYTSFVVMTRVYGLASRVDAKQMKGLLTAMRIFAIMRVTEPAKLEAAIASHFSGDRSFKLDERGWLVAGKGTAKEVSDLLRVSEGENGIAIVFRTEGYFGRAPSDIWDWIKTRTEEADG